MPKKEKLSQLALNRIAYCADASGLGKSFISESVGQEKSYLSGLLRTGREPGASTLHRMAKLFGVSTDFLLGFDDELKVSAKETTDQYAARLLSDITSAAARLAAANGQRLNFNQILEWWRTSDRKISGCSDVEEQFDLIEVPAQCDDYVKPHKVGKLSMAGTRVGHTADSLQRVVWAMPEGMRRQLVASYYDASIQGENYKITPHHMVLEVPEIEATIPLCYDRLLLPVSAGDGRKFIISHCYPASENGAEFQGRVRI
ncbi:helix-turn-helix domain-containing protein [Pacificoceanicola onchidii]|uniref:helix-turn-helix domain-containing protein n=1 Tax=Pacificoceanicola onchidii TaxID=2562685 RepID=UPI0010A42554|nr:helix-turn-helix transcriptional regulator [Pacificoceanicola onchidii]